MKASLALSLAAVRRAGFFVSVPVCALGMWISGCGGAPPPEAPPAPVAKPANPATPVDLSAVPEPRSLVLQARISRPDVSVVSVAALIGTTAPPSPTLIGEALTDVEVGDVLDLSQPVDVAVTFEGTARPDITWAVSAALTPGEPTLAKLREHFTMTTGQGGVSRLEIKKSEEVDTERRCALFPAFGPAALRIVCSDSERGIRDLGPYLARTRPRVPAGKDFELEARGAPMREFLTQGRQMLPAFASSLLGGKQRGVPGLSTVLKELATDAIDLGIDVDRLTFDATLADAGAEANLRLALGGSASTIGRFMTAHPEKAGPPPDTFFRLPGDSESAFFGRGWNENELARPKEVLFQFTRTLLDKAGMTTADAEALERAASGYLELGTNGWVSASGSDWAQSTAAVKKLTDAKRAGKNEAILDAERGALEKLAGWSLWGVESPMAKVQASVKDVVATFNRPALQKALKSQLPEGAPAPTLKLVPVPAALKLPKDSMHVELTVTRVVDESSLGGGAPTAAGAAASGKIAAPTSKPKLKFAKPVKIHGFVAADGARTWLAWGVDEAQVAMRLRAAVPPATAAPAATAATAAPTMATLSTRKGLESIQGSAAKWNGAGFMTARSLARSDFGATALFEPAGRLRAPDAERLASAEWGTNPMWIGSRAEDSGKARSLTVTLKVPADVIVDLGALRLGRGRRP